MFRRNVGHAAVVLFALSAVGFRDVAAQQGSAPTAPASAECTGTRGEREADRWCARSAIASQPDRAPGSLRPSLPLVSAADAGALSALAGAGFGGVPATRPALTQVWIEQPSAARRKPVWRYLALGAGIGGLSGGLLGWLAGEGMQGGTLGDTCCGHRMHTQTAVAMGIAGGAAFGTLVGLVVYALDAPGTRRR